MCIKLFLTNLYKDIIKLLKASDFNVITEVKIKVLGLIYQYKNIVFVALLLSLLTIILYIFFGQIVILAIIIIFIITATQIKK